ncbi:hypothetical protein CPB83DRAFT_763071, partial [Crepidotus variabilis]
MEVPKEAEIIGATRLRHGGVLYRILSEEGMVWLRGTGREGFEKNMGGDMMIKDRSVATIVEYVPVGFDTEDDKAKRWIEMTSGLDEKCIVRTSWIKPIAKRNKGQRVATLYLDFSSEAMAYRVIEGGIAIEGKMVNPRIKKREPRSCYKCHRTGSKHFAAQCTDEHDTCGYCGGGHRSNECSRDANGQKYCRNCQSTTHGPGDHFCPRYI